MITVLILFNSSMLAVLKLSIPISPDIPPSNSEQTDKINQADKNKDLTISLVQ